MTWLLSCKLWLAQWRSTGKVAMLNTVYKGNGKEACCCFRTKIERCCDTWPLFLSSIPLLQNTTSNICYIRQVVWAADGMMKWTLQPTCQILLNNWHSVHSLWVKSWPVTSDVLLWLNNCSDCCVFKSLTFYQHFFQLWCWIQNVEFS